MRKKQPNIAGKSHIKIIRALCLYVLQIFNCPHYFYFATEETIEQDCFYKNTGFHIELFFSMLSRQ